MVCDSLLFEASQALCGHTSKGTVVGGCGCCSSNSGPRGAALKKGPTEQHNPIPWCFYNKISISLSECGPPLFLLLFLPLLPLTPIYPHHNSGVGALENLPPSHRQMDSNGHPGRGSHGPPFQFEPGNQKE